MYLIKARSGTRTPFIRRMKKMKKTKIMTNTIIALSALVASSAFASISEIEGVPYNCIGAIQHELIRQHAVENAGYKDVIDEYAT
jgi:hypothetical protein